MKKNRCIFLWVVLAVFLTITSGCQSTNKNQTGGTQPVAKNTVIIQGYNFQPSELTVQKGETVKWINKDSVQHTATGASFDSGLLGKDKTFEHTFNEAGTFDYICTPHPYMKGKIIVK